MNYRFLVVSGIGFLKNFMVPGSHDQRFPVLALLGRHIEQQVEVDPDKTGDILGTLQISAHPVY